MSAPTVMRLLQAFIFETGNRSCAYVHDPSGHNLMIDCARSQEFSPALHIAASLLPQPHPLQGNKLTKLIITHPHKDHISDIDNVLAHFPPAIVLRNRLADYTPENIDNPEDPSVQLYRTHIDGVYTAPVDESTIPWHMTHKTFNLPPQEIRTLGISNELNNSSIVTLVEYAQCKILFGGDMETIGWLALLRRPDFQEAIRGVDVFITSHHGHSSGFCSLLYDHMGKPQLHIASLESGNEHLEPSYSSDNYCRGANVQRWDVATNAYVPERRNLLTTRNDRHIKITVYPNNSFHVFTGSDAAVLLR